MGDFFSGQPIVLGGLLVAALILGIVVDELRWKLKSEADLLEMTRSADPKKVMVGLTRLRKRNVDISEHIQRVLPFLVADRAVDRVTAKLAMQKLYPQDFELMRDYAGTESLEVCRAKLERLHEKHGLGSEGHRAQPS